MSNQSFDSNGTSSAGSSDSGEAPIPIAQQLSQQSYLCNIQHKIDELLKASGVEASDETKDSALPSSAASSLGASRSRSSAPKRVNKMDSFFAQAAAEEEAAAEELAAKLAAELEAKNAELSANSDADTDEGNEPLPIEANAYAEEEPLPVADTYVDANYGNEQSPVDAYVDNNTSTYNEDNTYAYTDESADAYTDNNADAYTDNADAYTDNTDAYADNNADSSTYADDNTAGENSYADNYTDADNYDSNEPSPIDHNQQEAIFNQVGSAEASVDFAEASVDSAEVPEDVPPSESRPTGYAGLSAGLAAAGLGNFAARLAQESTSTSDDEFVSEESQSSAEPPSMPSPPIVPVVEPSFSGHNFDLEAARLEEVSSPVFSHDFDEKEPSPEDRLANRLQRENLLPSENELADQPSNSQTPSLDQNVVYDEDSAYDQDANRAPDAPLGNVEALIAASVQEAEPTLDDSEPIADLFVEIPQVPQQPEVDQVSVDHQDDQAEPLEMAEELESCSIDQPAEEDFQPDPAMPPEENSSEASSSESPQMMFPVPLPLATQTSEASTDPRIEEAKRVEEEFKELHENEDSYVEQAQQEQIEHELNTAENLNDGEQKLGEEDDSLEGERQAEEEKFAAIQQAERVKAAREKASQVAREAEPVASPAEATEQPDLVQEEIETVPQPLVQPDDAQFANQPVLIQPGTVLPEVPSSEERSAAPDKQAAKQLASGHQFQFELFYTCMLEHLSDGVIFVDHKQKVKLWSRGAEKATGIIPGVVLDRPLLPQTISLCDTDGNGLQLDKCPVAKSLRTLEIVTGEYKIANSTRPGGMKVELTAIPVIDKNRYVNGAVVMFHDRTAQVNLQRQLKDLYEFSVLDPLTQVANRAEFERVQQEYVLAFQQSDDFNCSIIICDIDYFKSINDNFGHTVGDDALISFAEMLKRYVRPQDLVARYGGEEFVILCADCDTAAAVQRAEEIRMALYKTPQPMLDGKSISASFGVSELREGDTAQDFFVRADTALLKAKETGRNRVVAGDGTTPTGNDEPATELSPTGIRWKAQQRKKTALICEEFKTETPIQVLVEKLRGFIIDNNALLQRVEPDFLSMEVEVEAPMDYSRKGAFTMNVEFKETEPSESGTPRAKTLNYIRVTIYAGRLRNWFSTNHTDLAPHLLGELRRFLMIGDKASRLSVDMATKKVR